MAIFCAQASMRARRPPCRAHGNFNASPRHLAKYHDAGHSVYKYHRGYRAKCYPAIYCWS